MINKIVVFTFLLLVHSLFGQEKEKTMPEARIELQRDSILLSSDNQSISSKKINSYAPEDIGALTQKIAGVSLKNYGGIGGMKTIAYRGVSGTNTAILLDGFMAQNTMVGQLDLSNLQVDNVSSLSFTSNAKGEDLLPVSALLLGNVLSIKSIENRFSSDTLQFRYVSRIGSFGQLDNFVSVKRNYTTTFFSVYGKLRSFDGKYSYNLENGNSILSERRTNNDLKEGYGGFSFTKWIGFRSKFNTAYHFNESDRGLPGAVILYNNTANQRLKQQNNYWNTELIYCGDITKTRVYNTLQYGWLNYLDPSYLNKIGGLNQWYYNTTNQTGITMSSSYNDSIASFYGGIEHTFSTLTAPNQYAYSPQRFHIQSVIGGSFLVKKNRITLQLGNHSLKNIQANIQKTTTAWTYSLNVEKRNYSSWVGLPRGWVKRTFRMPSFSELFYNAIGNKELQPEVAFQCNVGTSYSFLSKNLGLSIDGYYNLVTNKILAIPTKNLFVWSIQNIGKVEIFGCDILLKKNWVLTPKLEVLTSINYSLQQVQDISSKDSPTYKNQIAYLPKHTIQSEISYIYAKKSGVNIFHTAISNRYSLNENTPGNEISGFSLVDLSIFHQWVIHKKSTLKMNASIKNMLNSNYQYISYFVMPGRNYVISLNYAFH